MLTFAAENILCMKKMLQALLQRLLGFDTYLFVFAIFKIRTLRWDPQEKEGDFNYFCKLLHPADVVLDIGANVGIMTALMARRCHLGRVLAFEPVPDNVKTLRRVIRYLKLPNVEVYPVALGNQNSTIEMTMPVLSGVRMQGLSHVGHESIADYEGPYISYEVPQQALDETGLGDLSRIAAIKMDVENYEQFILEGAMRLLQTHRPLIYCELWDNENRQRCFALLRSLGYEVQVLVAGDLQAFDPARHSHHNFFCIPSIPNIS